MVLYQVKILFKYLLRSTQFSFICLLVYTQSSWHWSLPCNYSTHLVVHDDFVSHGVQWRGLKKQTNRKTDLLTNYQVFLLDTCQDKYFVCCECTQFFLCMIWEHRRFCRTLFFFSTLWLCTNNWNTLCSSNLSWNISIHLSKQLFLCFLVLLFPGLLDIKCSQRVEAHHLVLLTVSVVTIGICR